MATTKATTLAHTLGGIAGSIETAEINRLDGVNADIQTQLDNLDTNKAPKASPTFTGTITAPNDSINGDFVSGGTIGAGTFNGTIGTSATIPASLSGLKLTASYSGNLNGNTPAYLVNGAFSSTYDSYLVMMHGQLSSNLDGESTLNMRMSKSDSTNSNNSCWSLIRGWDHNGTERSTNRGNSDSLYIVNGVDKNYPWGITFQIDKPGTSNHTFMQGTSCNFRDVDGLFAQTFSAFHGTNYSATGFALWWSLSGTQSTCNINIYGIDG